MTVPPLPPPTRLQALREPPLQRRVALSLVLLVGALLAVRWVNDRQTASRAVGIYLDESAGQLEIEQVRPGLPAERAGLEVGDRLVTVDGHAVGSHFEYDRAGRGFTPGRPVRMTVDRDGVERSLMVTPGVPFDWGDYLRGAFASSIHLALAVVVLLSGLRDRRATLLVALLAAIAVELALPELSVGRPLAGALVTAVYWLLTGLQYGVELHLASLIPQRRTWLSRPMVAGYYLLGAGYGVVMCLATLPGVDESALGAWTASRGGEIALQAWYLLWPLGVAALYALAASRWPEPLGRQQALLVLIGVIPWVALALWVSLAGLLGASTPLWLQVVEPLCLALYPATIFVALYRYHLFDFALVVRKSLVYTVLTSSLFLLFYAVLGIGGALSSRLAGAQAGSVWVIAVATLILGLVFAPLRRWVEDQIESRFFPERAALRERLAGLARDLPRHGKLPEISQVLVDELRQIFAASWAAVLLAEGDSGLLVGRAVSRDPAAGPGRGFLLSARDPFVQRLRSRGRPDRPAPWSATAPAARRLAGLGVELAVPVVADGRLIAVVLLGAKDGGPSYPAEETELLDLFSHHLANVIENVSLFESATTDRLTGLLRREQVLDQLDKEIERARRYDRPLAIAMADIDHFKGVNDRHGHLAGDVVLQRVARLLTESLRSTDLAGRYGGEEFLLVLPETPLAGAAAVMEKLRQTMEDLQVETGDGGSIRLTVSIGVASLEELPGGAASREALLAAADERLYEAKTGGRNQVAAGA